MFLQITGAITALVAAGFWFWSSMIVIPDFMEMKITGPGSPTDYMKRQARLSAIAATFAGLSALTHVAFLYLQISN